MHDLFHLEGLAHGVGQVAAARLGGLHQLVQELLRPLDDLVPLCDPDILDLLDRDPGLARPDPVDGLERGREDCGLDLVEARRDVDDALGLPLLVSDLDLDPAYPATLLQVSQVQLVTEQSLCLSEDGSNDVRLLDYAVLESLAWIRYFVVLGSISILFHLLRFLRNSPKPPGLPLALT